MMGKRSIERRLSDLETEQGMDDDRPDEVVITSYVVDENGENPEPFDVIASWRDDAGEWHGEHFTPDDSEFSEFFDDG